MFYWTERTWDLWGDTLDDHRACMLFVHRRCYWPPRAAVRAWLTARWEAWCDPATRPVWFVREWRARFPADWLPDDFDDDFDNIYDGKLNDLQVWLQ